MGKILLFDKNRKVSNDICSNKRNTVIVDTDGKVTITNERNQVIYTRKMKLRPRKQIKIMVSDDFCNQNLI